MRRTIETSIDSERGVFMISVAAELADMHPQTLRMYEARGLIAPQRSPKNTRLYSQSDVERLRRIQQMTSQEGLNLAGVETVLEMEKRVEEMRAELERVRARAEGAGAAGQRRRPSGHPTLKTEIVPYGAYEGMPAPESGGVRIPIERPRKDGKSR